MDNVPLVDSLTTTPVLEAVFSDAALLNAMVRFEAALARAEAEHGVIPADAGRSVSQTLSAAAIDTIGIAMRARNTGTVVIPLLEALTAAVNAANGPAATFVHWGATSQDVSDTATVLCLREAQTILGADHQRLISGLRILSDSHASSVMLARTLLQPAGPTTFGLTAAAWLAAVARGYARLTAAFGEACVLQFGGPAGTLAALGDRGAAVAATLARELGLAVPDAPWHTHRDRLAALVCACGVYVGSLAKIARDVSLLMQYEVREAAEPGGGSSSMPHKRNPAGCAIVLAAANRLPGLVSSFLSGMVQEHERAVGGWHAEAATLSATVKTTGSAVAALTQVVEAMLVDPERMRANIESTGGSVFAERALVLMAPKLGKPRASTIVADALARSSASGALFRDALAENSDARKALGSALPKLDEPQSYLGAAEHFRKRLLDSDD